tara:strand:- start:296 stop:955 length:660 start_codon:yes stop_codon:yes gene_type:complete
MKIDIRDVRCCWVNLDKDKDNAASMVKQFDEIGLKNHERLSARIVEPPSDTPKTIYHYRGCAQSHIDILDNENNELPLLILEDDAKITEDFNPIIEVPDDTDAVYLGTSHGDGNYIAMDIGNGFARIGKIFATHAILYLTDKYRKVISETAKDFVYKRNTPFDLGCAWQQTRHMVVAPHKPYFYQADERDSANKWENLTRTPIRIVSTKHEQAVDPLGA